ncbi:MAG TPA: endonuclease/exonuclease/phosphatase family protein [Ilumatobacteraceae bacterium]|nr:endonuclease/exonuclease/phosphatase family protein [Ilumatobacteraceae bacterium]
MWGGEDKAGHAIVGLLAWLLVATVGVVTITQALGWSPSRGVAVAQALTPHLGLILVPAALYSLWRSARIMTMTCIAIGLGLLILATPLAFPADRPQADPDATGLRVASINLYVRNDRVDEIARRLHDLEPDVIVFVEYTRRHRKALQTTELAADYPHRTDRNARGDGVAVWSRTPIAVGDDPDTTNDSLDVVVDGPDGPVRLLALHVPTPISTLDGWKDDLDTAARSARTATGAVMIVGDLNASYWHPPFRDLLDAGLTDAHTAVGAGFSSSWPTNRLIPAFVRLDHALLTDELVAVDVQDFDAPGSDHRGFVVTVVPAR